MKITVKESSSGKELVLENVQLDNTVRDLKRMIHKETGYGCPVHMQWLIHCGQVMEDEHALNHYKFQHSSPYKDWETFSLNVVHLFLRRAQDTPKPSFFTRPATKAGPIEIRIHDVTRNVQDEVRTLHVMPYHYVEELKAMINEERYTLPIDNFNGRAGNRIMSLLFLGRHLQDGRTLEEYGVLNHDEIHVMSKPAPYRLYAPSPYGIRVGKKVRRKFRLSEVNLEALVQARRLSRHMLRGTIPRVDFPTVLSLVAEDVSAAFAVVRSNPTMFAPGFFDGVSGRGRSAEEIMNAHAQSSD